MRQPTFRDRFTARDLMNQDEDYDSDELKHNCHSDPDLLLDDDPMYEYNKCHTFSFIEKKCEDPTHKFERL
jgi:hypothetical protein